jgi:hypothetical protein
MAKFIVDLIFLGILCGVIGTKTLKKYDVLTLTPHNNSQHIMPIMCSST